MTLTDYLYRKSTKPIMTIRFRDRQISGAIYGICTPEVTRYKYSYSIWDERFRRSFSHEVMKKSWTDQKIVDEYEKKGWQWDWITPYSGYEIDCLTKTEPFKELPKGDKLIGVTWHQILKGRSEIESYMRINFRSFAPIAIYRVPASVQL